VTDYVELVRRTNVALGRLKRLGALEAVLAIVREYGCRTEDVLGGDRHKTPAAARHRIWMLLRHTLDLSYPEIAGAMGWGDHTTVMSGVKKQERLLRARYSEAVE
jgi:chromosomal replication initiation ATPase DnaA